MMLNKFVLAGVLTLSFILSACSGGSDKSTSTVVPIPQPEPTTKSNAEEIDALWSQTVSQLVTEPLWSERDKYDTANLLMQPMQYAFVSKDQAKQTEWLNFFTQLDTYFAEAIGDNRVSTTQFMYFVSEYLVLQQQAGNVSSVTTSLFNKTQNWLVSFINSPAWMYGRDPFDTLIARTQWKLDTQEVDFSYYRAMFDEDLHSLATMANLYYLSQQSEFSGSTEFLQLAQQGVTQLKRMLEQEVSFTESGKDTWLFQPGVWWQHPNYAHVGHAALALDLERSPMESIATDSSHTHRWPLWLKAYNRAFVGQTEMTNYITRLQTGLAQQFNQKVYVPASEEVAIPRINNFFDGHNGIYRYNYTTNPGTGYGPYQLSSILYAGWYGNLIESDSFATDIRAILARENGLTEAELEVYVGPNTTRERNPLFVWPDYFNNDMGKLNLRVTLALLTSTN